MKYAKIKDGKVKKIHDLEQKHRVIRYGGKKIVNPRKKHYVQAGWLPVIRPTPGPGQTLGRRIIEPDRVTWELVPIDKMREWQEEMDMFRAEFPDWALDILRIAQGRKTIAECPKLKALLDQRKEIVARKPTT